MSEQEPENYSQYSQRIGDEYKEIPHALFENILSFRDLKTTAEKETWKQKHTVREASDESNNDKEIHTLRIDYIGMAAVNFLTGGIGNNDRQSTGYKVSNAFKDICSFDFTRLLKDNNILLRIRFVFPYLYSHFAVAMAESAESVKSVPVAINDRKTRYNFNVEKLAFESSKIRFNQIRALEVIEKLTRSNIELKLTCLEDTQATIAVNFTCLPINAACLVIGGIAFTDSYQLLKLDIQDEIPDYPVSDSNICEQPSVLYTRAAKSFDYYWASELTLFFEDATRYKPTSENSLSQDKTPKEISGEGFKYRLIRTLKDTTATQDEPAAWAEALKKRFLRYCNDSTSIEYDQNENAAHLNYLEEENKKASQGNKKVSPSHSAIEIGFKTVDKREYYFFNLTVNGIVFKEFRKEKKGSDVNVNWGIGLQYKILLHYCFVKKGLLTKGSIFEKRDLEYFEAQQLQLTKKLRELVDVKKYKEVDHGLIKNSLIDFSEKVTIFHINDITFQNVNQQNFEDMSYKYRGDRLYVFPAENLKDSWDNLQYFI